VNPVRLAPFACIFLTLSFSRAQTGKEVAVPLAQFVVTPSRYGVTEDPSRPTATLSSRDLEILPQVGDDLARSIARLPGLASDDYKASFWVRGAPNSQLLARLDGVTLLEPFHLKDIDGALSIVDPRIISRLDLATGGFAADYGDRQAGVLTMETRSPTRRRTALELSLTGIGANAAGLFAESRGRWLMSVRRGYPDVALRAIHREDEIKPVYYDATAQIAFHPAAGQTVSVHALHSGDSLSYHRQNNPDLVSSYASDYAWARWQGVFSPRLSTEAVLSFTRLTWNREGAGTMDSFPFFSGIIAT
jgi:outer membrane receptor protein involved in Fe transport